MAVLKMIDPVTRLEGHLKIDIVVDTINNVQQIVDAYSTGTLFRGFEKLLEGRPPTDAAYVTQRICGVCPVSHSLAAVETMEAVAKITVPANARIIRNLILGSNFISSHVLHFYHLALLDYIDGPGMLPWQPGWNVDKRIIGTLAQTLITHYQQALDIRRQAHEMGAVFGGRLPHPAVYVPGGVTVVPTSALISKFNSLLSTITTFIRNVYLPDVTTVSQAYADYYKIGRGNGNLLAFGVFDLDTAGSTKLLKRGASFSGSTAVASVNLNSITEQVTYSWYDESTNNLNPANGKTTPVYPKTNAYSWMKAPRYNNAPCETGALARMWVNGDYRKGISVMDRHQARAQEALKIATAMAQWVSQLSGSTVYTPFPKSITGSGIGLTEAARGALGHWASLSNNAISKYQVVTPTCWNASPRDTSKVRGPLEQALIGTPIKNIDMPVEAMRVVHSYDPCLACAVHAMRPEEDAKIYALGAVLV